MKRLLLVLASMASLTSTFAQDYIVKRDGEEIQCRILEVSTNKVKYKQWKNQDGPTFVEKKSDVLMLKYENGQKEVISFSAPVSPTQVEENVVTEVAVDSAALADTMPISNNFLEYSRKEKSGLLMWGRSITELQAHTIMGKDWTDFTRAHKNERMGRSLIFAGGALILGGGAFTALYIHASNDYKDKKAAYDNHWNEANAKYQTEVNGLDAKLKVANENKSTAKKAKDVAEIAFTSAKENFASAEKYYEKVKNDPLLNSTANVNDALAKMNQASKEMSDAEDKFIDATNVYNHAEANVIAATNNYQEYLTNGTENFNKDFYISSYKTSMDDAERLKKAFFAPMIGCYASGAALLVWGIIKEKRALKKVNGIVNRLNEEDAYPGEIQQIESRKMPEFDIQGKDNGLAFVLKF